MNSSTCRVEHQPLYWRSVAGRKLPTGFSPRATESGRRSGPGARMTQGHLGAPDRQPSPYCLTHKAGEFKGTGGTRRVLSGQRSDQTRSVELCFPTSQKRDVGHPASAQWSVVRSDPKRRVVLSHISEARCGAPGKGLLISNRWSGPGADPTGRVELGRPQVSESRSPGAPGYPPRSPKARDRGHPARPGIRVQGSGVRKAGNEGIGSREQGVGKREGSLVENRGQRTPFP